MDECLVLNIFFNNNTIVFHTVTRYICVPNKGKSVKKSIDIN